ncbi:MAG: hydrogenase maturation nickel metallochaperone HypA [Cyanobacteriota bacterium]|nr:hydrogenase maturation nickel metallochaperone HypA [Cyanobacteriota bacterium]
MHELSLMQTLGERVLSVAAAEGAEKVVAIRLRIGTLAGVDPDALRFAAEVVLADTLAANATLTIEEIPATWWCAPCGAEFTTPPDARACPRCGALSARLLRGQDLSLVSVELVP